MPAPNIPGPSSNSSAPINPVPGGLGGGGAARAGAGSGPSGRTGYEPHLTPIPGAKKYKSVGDYDIVSKLGKGGMGSVYLALRKSTGEQVALKILSPELVKDTEMYHRFLREARATQRFSHPHIVCAVDFGSYDKYHYIAMQYVDGPDLEKMLKTSGKFEEEMLLRMAAQMALALEAIEAQGIVHRDIKPSNIMMTSQGIFRLTDLGLSSAGMGDERVTMVGSAVGTPYYISPEQAKGQLDVDIRADIYGLGATLYHLATGSVPFPGNNDVAIMTAHLLTPPKPPEELEPSVSPHVSALIQRMMEKDPDRRPQNAAELRKMIEQCMRGEMPETPKPHDGGRQAPNAGERSGLVKSVFGFFRSKAKE